MRPKQLNALLIEACGTIHAHSQISVYKYINRYKLMEMHPLNLCAGERTKKEAAYVSK